jgi:hypothetical protein
VAAFDAGKVTQYPQRPVDLSAALTPAPYVRSVTRSTGSQGRLRRAMAPLALRILCRWLRPLPAIRPDTARSLVLSQIGTQGGKFGTRNILKNLFGPN